jgi:hypothetical protein
VRHLYTKTYQILYHIYNTFFIKYSYRKHVAYYVRLNTANVVNATTKWETRTLLSIYKNLIDSSIYIIKLREKTAIYIIWKVLIMIRLMYGYVLFFNPTWGLLLPIVVLAIHVKYVNNLLLIDDYINPLDMSSIISLTSYFMSIFGASIIFQEKFRWKYSFELHHRDSCRLICYETMLLFYSIPVRVVAWFNAVIYYSLIDNIILSKFNFLCHSLMSKITSYLCYSWWRASVKPKHRSIECWRERCRQFF